jgi:hypothetical protein
LVGGKCESAFTLRSIIALLTSIVLTTGCSSSVSLTHWQKALEKHIADNAGGDSSFLREDNGDSLPRFAVLGHALPEKSTDVSGVVLGRRSIAGTEWLIFLTAAVKHEEVEDIRLALYDDGPGPPRWVISEPNPDALTAYERARVSRWRKLHPVRTTAPATEGLFPPEDDRFQLTIAGNTASVVHEDSGARWTVVVVE